MLLHMQYATVAEIRSTKHQIGKKIIY